MWSSQLTWIIFGRWGSYWMSGTLTWIKISTICVLTSQCQGGWVSSLWSCFCLPTGTMVIWEWVSHHFRWWNQHNLSHQDLIEGKINLGNNWQNHIPIQVRQCAWQCIFVNLYFGSSRLMQTVAFVSSRQLLSCKRRVFTCWHWLNTSLLASCNWWWCHCKPFCWPKCWKCWCTTWNQNGVSFHIFCMKNLIMSCLSCQCMVPGTLETADGMHSWQS